MVGETVEETDTGHLLEGLDLAQREAVMSPGAPLCVLAGAGSGKTRVLTRRIARRVIDGSADPHHVVAITFTRRAARELTVRLGALGLRERLTAGTFHGIAWGLLRQRWADQGRSAPELVPNKLRILAAVVAGEDGRHRGQVPLADLATEIDWCRARLVTAEQYETEARRAERKPGITPERVSDVLRRYEAMKRKQRVVDFDDLLSLCANEINRDPNFGEVVRWRFRHLFVDEFQDVNPLQIQLLEAVRGGRDDLCVVGDPRQAIYGWNGSDPAILEQFGERWPGATIVRLDRNYRSTPQVVAAAEAVLVAGGIAAPGLPGVAADGPAVRVHRYADDLEEADGIVGILRESRGVRRWGSAAVLVRTHAQVAPIEHALEAAGIPTRTRTGTGMLDDPIVRAALHDATGYPDPGGLHAWLDDQRTIVTGPEGEPMPPTPALVRLADLADDFLATVPDGTVAALRTWLAAGGNDDGGARDAVDVITFHAAKGLEWPVVVVAGFESGLVPHVGAGTAHRTEEVRLAYVALSRATERLHVTWAARRIGKDRSPSPWLNALAATAVEVTIAPPITLHRSPRTETDPVLAALHRWRHAAARAARLPERTVCTDEALSAIAMARPRTIDELAALPAVGRLAANRLGPRLLVVVGEVVAAP
jgi:DNA helicase-2/ATP-dependent DNA helicase PcrA